MLGITKNNTSLSRPSLGKNLIMYHGVSYGKFNTALMLKINTVTSLMCLHTFPVPEAYFCSLRVEELNELTVR